MYLDQLKQLEVDKINEKYQLPYSEKEHLEKILKLLVESQLKLKDLESLEKLKEYSKEPIDVIKLSAALNNHTLSEVKEIHKTLDHHGYYNGHDFILINDRRNTEPLEEEILEALITDYYFVEEAFDLDYLIEIFVEEKTHEGVIRELMLEEDLIENLLKIQLVDISEDVNGNVIKMGHKYY